MDTERRDALARFDDAAIVRFAERWLAPGERAWCAAQADVRQAMVLCVAAKEAVWKAVGGAVPLQRIEVAGRTGLRSRIGVPGADVRLRLETPPGAGGDVVATAMAIRRRDA